MSQKRKIFTSAVIGAMDAWNTITEEGRAIVVKYDPSTRDMEAAIVLAASLIPRGWTQATNRPASYEIGKIEVPLRRRVRGVGR